MSDVKTCFKRVDYDLGGLLHYIDIGDIGLPDIQRPFVWSNAKVRDLFDSMYRGFPVGYLLFWENGQADGARQIGIGQKAHSSPSRLIVDGQQRLTSLYAVFRGKAVLDDDYRERQIEIAFRPRDAKFDVADAAIRRDPEWIPNISTLWASGKSSYQLVKSFLESIRQRMALTDEAEEEISHNLDRLFDLQKYPFTALEIAPSVEEEQVADIFVRINSEGVRLNQADFILTLLSVFWDDGRRDLEAFCRESREPPGSKKMPSPFNHFIQPDPDQLLRVSVALGFDRARLQSVYQVLRGKDLDTGEFSAQRRDAQFDVLKKAQARVLDLTVWHQFLSALTGAGFRGAEMVSSQNAMLYAYALYLIGRDRYSVPEHTLQRIVARWFFFSTLTGRYTNGPESVMDRDLNRIGGSTMPAQFVRALDSIIETEFTEDYWRIALPAALGSSSARNPQLFAYFAAQIRLGAPVLFSHKMIGDLIDPSLKPKKKALDRHHLFPRSWLEKQGITDLKIINQMANFALLEWPENLAISDTSPTAYLPAIRGRFSDHEWQRMCELHALPDGWDSLDYSTFLSERRQLMAAIIHRGFQTLN
ncbi:MAG: DUF262 domain-containing protein [Chloroflexota bacterium]|nr:MAG: DUF262 domain-containing protein [Chloroflexota bacterium]